MLVLAVSEIQLFVPGAEHAVGHLVLPAPPRRSLSLIPFQKIPLSRGAVGRKNDL